jgi:hypothetical protein
VLGGGVTMDGSASTGNDIFYATLGTGACTFITGSGNDIIGLAQGTNQVKLGTGTTTVYANTGNAGVSFITAGTGSANIALGGQSVDLAIAAASAPRTIQLFNFVPGADAISLSGFADNTGAGAIAAQTQGGGGTTITLPDQTTILLVGISGVASSLFG